MSAAHWLCNAALASGRSAGSLAGTVGRSTGAIGRGTVRLGEHLGRDLGNVEHDALRVPVVGPLLHGALVLGEGAALPFVVSYQVARGGRIDRVLVSQMRRQLKAIHEIAPYAQAVISFIPGIGPGISAGIGAGLALASGKPIDQVLLAAVRGAVPGGAIAQVAFDMGHAAMRGEKIENILATGAMDGLSAVGVTIPDEAKKAILTGLHAASRLARGEPIDHVLADTAIEGLSEIPGMPPAAAKAIKDGIKTGVAMAHGERLQTALKNAIPDAVGALVEAGRAAVDADPTKTALAHALPPESRDGLHAAVDLMRHNVGPVEISAVRHELAPHQRLAFDAGLALHIGETTHFDLDHLTPSERAGYLLVKGLRGATEAQRVAILSQLSQDPDARRGAVIAFKEVAATREPWWSLLRRTLGLEKESTP